MKAPTTVAVITGAASGIGAATGFLRSKYALPHLPTAGAASSAGLEGVLNV